MCRRTYEDIKLLAFMVANRLTQEQVAFTVRGKMELVAGVDPKPHKCAGGASLGSLPPTIQPDEKHRLLSLQAALQRLEASGHKKFVL